MEYQLSLDEKDVLSKYALFDKEKPIYTIRCRECASCSDCGIDC